jgi:hypothetical protein
MPHRSATARLTSRSYASISSREIGLGFNGGGSGGFGFSGTALCPLERHDDGSAIFDRSYYVLGPKIQRLAFLLVIGRAVVDACDATFYGPSRD